MKMPRDISGLEPASLLRRHYGYAIIRQNGSHLQLVSHYRGYEGHVTVPNHDSIRVGTITRTLNIVAAYLEIDRAELALELFGR